MNTPPLYESLKNELAGNVEFLEDKPEEDPDSTLKALWLAAAGENVSCERARDCELPPLDAAREKALRELVEQRLNNVPLAHLTKRQSFMGIELLSDRRALIPRKETEILGHTALRLSEDMTAAGSGIVVVDVCCGCGNLAVALAELNPHAKVYAADLSEEAVELAKENVTFRGLEERVQVEQSDFLTVFETDEFMGKVDLITCNPPYISSGKVPRMNTEIASNEPALAFDGGMMGFNIISKIITESPRFLKSGGWVVFEVGLGQGPFVVQMLERTESYLQVEPVNDACGDIRVIAAKNK